MTPKNCANSPKLVPEDLFEKSFVRNVQLPKHFTIIKRQFKIFKIVTACNTVLLTFFLFAFYFMCIVLSWKRGGYYLQYGTNTLFHDENIGFSCGSSEATKVPVK